MAVENLFPAKFAKIKSRQDALQTTFSVFLEFSIPQIWAVLRKRDFFNIHGLFALILAARFDNHTSLVHHYSGPRITPMFAEKCSHNCTYPVQIRISQLLVNWKTHD